MNFATIQFIQSRSELDTALTWHVHKPKSWPSDCPQSQCYFQNAITFFPPRPKKVLGKGYARLTIGFNKAEYWFSSVWELDHFIEVFSKKNLPQPRKLAEEIGSPWVNQVWLSRVYKGDWKYRQKLLSYIQHSDSEFRSLVGTP